MNCDPLSDAAVQFFLNIYHQEYKFDEKLEDLGKKKYIIAIDHCNNWLLTFTGSRVQKNWYTVKTKDEEDFMMLTIVILKKMIIGIVVNHDIIHCTGPSVWKLPSAAA